MYQAIYRKWRPASFDDVRGQEHITSVLKNQLIKDRLSHAYIFCGSRGTGKTTCAKILAKAVNCENPQNGSPCDICDSCRMINEGTTVDVVELDAASNNSVNDIRALCEEVVYPPAQLKKRVYIIDEVHMLSASAFNALLKTLEEPPSHTMFILATTDVHKVLATVMSRCQRFDFLRIKKQTIVDRIMQIASAEGYNVERRAAEIIAGMADGGMRDALSILESCVSNDEFVTAEKVTAILGLTNRELLYELFRACNSQNPARALNIVGELYEQNSSMSESFSGLADICRDLLIIKNVPSPKSFIDTTDEEFEELCKIAEETTEEKLLYFMSEMENGWHECFGSNRRASAEITVIKMCNPAFSLSSQAAMVRLDKLEKQLASGDIHLSVPAAESKPALKIPTEAKKEAAQKKSEETVKAAVKDSSRYEKEAEFKEVFGAKEPMLKFFFSESKIERQGNTLFINCSGMAYSLLNDPNKLKIALDIAKTLTADIEKIELKEDKAPESGKADLPVF